MAISAIVAFLIIASAQLVAGRDGAEVLRDRPRRGRRAAVARPLQAFSVLFHPLIVALTAVADRILRLLGVDMSESARRLARTSSSA